MTDIENLRVHKAPRVLVQDLDGEAVLLNLENGQYYGLDEVGFRMYHLLITSGSFNDAYKSLLGEYDTDPGELRTDLKKLLDHLVENGLVQCG